MSLVAVQREAIATPNYGVDSPAVPRNLFLAGMACLLLAIFLPSPLHLRPVLFVSASFVWPGVCLLAASAWFLLYVKIGKFRHRDFMLNIHTWRGNERVLDVGCGRGLLQAGAAVRLAQLGGTGRVTGIDTWSNQDMGGNSAKATRQNLELEDVSDRCDLLNAAAEAMPFEDESFDLVVSNLCLHNIEDRVVRAAAISEIARVVKPGGTAIISDYKHTAEYAGELLQAGFLVHRRWGSFLFTFPTLRVVVAHRR